MIKSGRARLLPSRIVFASLVIASYVFTGAVEAQEKSLRALVIGDSSGAIGSRVAAAGYAISSAGLEAIADTSAFQTANPNLLVLCDASRLPVQSVDIVQAYLNLQEFPHRQLRHI